MISPSSNKFHSVIFTIAITSVLFTLFLLSLPAIDKFKAKTISSASNFENETLVYNDIDFDGNSEGFHFLTNPNNGLSHYVFYKNGKQLYQQNLKGSFFPVNYFCFGDYNHDNQNELFLFWYIEDSLFVNVINAISEEIIAEKVFVTTFTFDHKTIDSILDNFYFFDSDKDGYDELFFSMSCGFSVINRKNILYNVKKNKFKISDPRGVILYSPAVFKDISGDSIPEIFGTRSSHGNTKTDYFLTDQKVWLFLADIQHQFKFTPKAIGDYPGMVATAPLILNEKPAIAALIVDYGETYDSTFLAICSIDGEIMNKVKLKYSSALHNSIFKSFPETYPNNIRILMSEGTLMEFNSALEKTKTDQMFPFIRLYDCLDIDGDNSIENIFLGNQYNMIITDHDFKNPVSINLENIEFLKNMSIVKEKDKNNLLSVVTKNLRYLIEYRKNPFYNFRFAIYLMSWSVLFSMIFLAGRFYQKLAIKKYESEKQLATLQISALEKQLTPHFNLNILNSIGALYETHDTSKAQYYLGKYGKLLRDLLMRSDRIVVSMEEELDFTRNYLELEKLRMNNSFEYKISGEADFLNVEIPKMLIHTFCENSLKHGLRHLRKNGRLDIRFLKENLFIKIIVSDNGIGRTKASQYSLMSTGQGLKILNQSLNIYFQLKNVKITYKISDIYDDAGNQAGTEVEITIPN